jgi:DNA replication regulator SLD2
VSIGNLFLRLAFYTDNLTVRPVQVKPEPEPKPDDALSEDDNVPAGVAESQIPSAEGEVLGEVSEDGDEDAGSCYDSDASDASQITKKKAKRKMKAGSTEAKSAQGGKSKADSKSSESKTEKAGEGKFRKTVRKFNEQAHANYRRLKIKNKNSKANGRGRFGRGRR